MTCCWCPVAPVPITNAIRRCCPGSRQRRRRARRFGSICTGAFVLGHAGLLDGHRVTTHWHYTERLIKAFPNAIVETDRIYPAGRAV